MTYVCASHSGGHEFKPRSWDLLYPLKILVHSVSSASNKMAGGSFHTLRYSLSTGSISVDTTICYRHRHNETAVKWNTTMAAHCMVEGTYLNTSTGQFSELWQQTAPHCMPFAVCMLCRSLAAYCCNILHQPLLCTAEILHCIWKIFCHLIGLSSGCFTKDNFSTIIMQASSASHPIYIPNPSHRPSLR